MPDVRKAVTMCFKKPGDFVYVVGATHDELGGSEFYQLLAREQDTPQAYGGHVPGVDPETALRTYRVMNEAAEQGLLASSHTPTLGGLAVGFALPAVGGALGAEIDLMAVPHDAASGNDVDTLLFSETNSRFIVTCKPGDADALEAILADVPFARVGEVTRTPHLVIRGNNQQHVIDAKIENLRNAFRRTLHGI
jgi:phosphoribosylformylglycinamidine synthase